MLARNLSIAANTTKVETKIKWEPFLLNANTPEEGEDMMEHLTRKYGPGVVARFAAPNNPLDVAGARVGITFNRNRRVIPTIRCHQLMEWVNKTHPEKANELMEKLFKAYFEDAIDVSKVGTFHNLTDHILYMFQLYLTYRLTHICM